MKYKFKESQLSDVFALEKREELISALSPSGFVTLSGMPAVGISPFVRFIATRTKDVTYLDILSLPEISRSSFYAAVLHEFGVPVTSRDEVMLLEQLRTIVASFTKPYLLIVNRFDELCPIIDSTFLSNLRLLRMSAPDLLSIVIVSHIPLPLLVPDAVMGANLDAYSKVIYVTPYTREDIARLVELFYPNSNIKGDELDLLFAQVGGHYQLIRHAFENGGETRYSSMKIQSTLRQIYSALSYTQRKELQKIVFGKSLREVDEYLLSAGIVKQEGSSYILWSPLFSRFIFNQRTEKLPMKEAALFRFLKKRIGKIVMKEEIFQALWAESEDGYGSDWALNALIYRLRKNPTFRASGYILESHKKQGYTLVQV